MPHLIVIRSIPPYAEKGNIFVFLPGREGWAASQSGEIMRLAEPETDSGCLLKIGTKTYGT